MSQNGDATPLSPADLATIDNLSFLRALFGRDWGDVHVTGFPGDPQDPALRLGWGGGRARNWRFDPTHNNYFTVALFTGTNRQKQFFRELRVLGVDDVVSVIDPAEVRALFGEPTYRIETSPGSEQWGYRLAAPIRDLAVADALLSARNKALLGGAPDTGMANVTRYLRLPVGTNGKIALAGCKTRLVELEPDRELTQASILRALGVDVSPVSPANVVPFPVPTVTRVPPVSNRFDALAEQDIIFQAMRRLDLVLGAHPRNSAMGRCWDVVCPWSDEHTGRAASGTAYVPILQRFQCHHGHCLGRTGEDLGERLDTLLRADSGGVCGLVDLEWDDLPPDLLAGLQGPPGGAGVPMVTMSPADRFFDTVVYLPAQDRWFDMETLIVAKTDRYVNAKWARPLRDVLPAKKTARGDGPPVTPTQYFMSNAARGRHLHGLVNWPGEDRIVVDDKKSYANLWRDVPRPLRHVPDADVDTLAVSPWLDVFWLVMGMDTLDQIEIGEIVLDWLALVIGSHVKGGWQVVLTGGQGIGKDLIVRPLVKALGRQAQTLSAADITHEFNEWTTKRFVLCNEMRQTTRGTTTPHDQMARFKSVFDPGKEWLSVNPKFGVKHEARNVVMAWSTSNEDTPVQLDDDDRRVLLVHSEAKPWPDARYQSLIRWLDQGGDARVAEFLWRRWDEINVPTGARLARLLGRAPMTGDKQEVIEQGRDPLIVFLEDLFEIEPPDSEALPAVVSIGIVHGRIIQAQKNGRLAGVRVNPNPVAIAKQMRRAGAQQPTNEAVKVNGRRVRVWSIRNHEHNKTLSDTDLAQIIARENDM